MHPRPVPAGLDLQDDDGAGGLEAGISPDHQVSCPGYIVWAGAVFHCWKEHGHGRIGMVQALGQSCDVYFYELARRVGIDAIAAMADASASAEARHRSARRAAGADPDHGLEAGDAGRELAEGRDPGLRHRPGLRLGDAAAARGDDGAPGQWRLRRHALAGARRPAEHRQPIGVPQAPWTSSCAACARSCTAPAAPRGRRTWACRASRWRGKTGTSQVRRISRADRAAGRHKRKDIPWDERDHALFVCFAPLERRATPCR